MYFWSCLTQNSKDWRQNSLSSPSLYTKTHPFTVLACPFVINRNLLQSREDFRRTAAPHTPNVKWVIFLRGML